MAMHFLEYWSLFSRVSVKAARSAVAILDGAPGSLTIKSSSTAIPRPAKTRTY